MTRRSTWLAGVGKFAVIVETSTRSSCVAAGLFARTRAECEHRAEVLQADAVRLRRRRTRYTVVRVPDDVVDLYRAFDRDVDELHALLTRAYRRRDAVRATWERSLASSLPDDGPF